MAIITFLAHVFLLLSLSFFIIIRAEDFSPWLKGKLDDNDNEINNNDDHENGFSKHNCSGKQIFCRKDGDGPKGKKKKIMKCCKHRCVDLRSDIENCGFCGKICPFPKQCCKGFCVDTNTSKFHCGKCGNKCRFRVRCVYGMCGYGQPDPPRPSKGWWKPRHPPKDHYCPPPVDGRRSYFA